MEQFHTKLNDDGKLHIPLSIRKELNLQTGDDITMRVIDGELRIRSVKQSLTQLQTMFKDKNNVSLSEALLTLRREEAKSE